MVLSKEINFAYKKWIISVIMIIKNLQEIKTIKYKWIKIMDKQRRLFIYYDFDLELKIFKQ